MGDGANVFCFFEGLNLSENVLMKLCGWLWEGSGSSNEKTHQNTTGLLFKKLMGRDG